MVVHVHLNDLYMFTHTLDYRYTFSFGSAYFVVISTEHDFTEGSLQYEFIVSSLMSVDRTTVSWVVVAGHRYECAFLDIPLHNSVHSLLLRLYVHYIQ